MSTEAADARFLPRALDGLRTAIDEAGGNEVFLVGRIDEARRVERVEVHARGHEAAAPALLNVARPGEVVIHNHPSGELRPSEDDLSVASALGNLGVGFLIVDNPVKSVYVVVEPRLPVARELLDREEIALDLGPDGGLARTFSGYEHREAQIHMSREVARAFDEDRLSMIEAGTGTGKSFAYLFPAARFSHANAEKVVVSTNTINLQSQLLDKDVPQVSRALGEEVRATILKGRTNYICRRKLEEAIAEPGLFDRDESRQQLERISEIARCSREGSRQDLGFVPDPEVWERVQSESDTTLRVRCPHYNDCFFYESRRRAAASDVVVVNHHLLLSDAVLRREVGFGVSALLPPYRRLVIDEAHHLEGAATEHMSERVTRLGLLRILNRLISSRRVDRGRIPALITRLCDLARTPAGTEAGLVASRLADEVVPAHRRLVGEIEAVFEQLELGFVDHLGRTPALNHEVKQRLLPGFTGSDFFVETLRPGVLALIQGLSAYVDRLGGAIRLAESLPEEVFLRFSGPLLDVRSGCRRLESRVSGLRFFLDEDEEHCRWVEYRQGRRFTVLGLCVSPIEVGGELREVLFDRVSTGIMTSATLRAGGDFSYLKGRLGLTDGARGRLGTLDLPSPFDFERQAWVGVPTDLPPPNAPAFPEQLSEAVIRAVEASRGRAFVLFTSYRLLNQVYDRVRDHLECIGCAPLKQGAEDRHRLLDRFRTDVSSVLLATSSFWEGVDVPGEALQLVILTRLPFAVPDEPILQARAEAIEARGGDAFREYSVPQAVLRFRQGFGRLIRSRTDRGAVLTTDRRILEKRYGREFLAGLPTQDVRSGAMEDLAREMREFLSGPAQAAG